MPLSDGRSLAIAHGVNRYHLATFLAGAIAVIALSGAASVRGGPALVSRIERDAIAARDRAGGREIDISFATPSGWLTRHPKLSGGRDLDDVTRARVALAISEVPGIGGVSWSGPRRSGGRAIGAGRREAASLHCQDDVEAILKARSIRFTEGSARIDSASQRVLDEVAAALGPCVGSIIAVKGHTDGNGDEDANVALSLARAEAVRWALIGRGIPADGLRAAGLGSAAPLERLNPTDPANRRIEFSVIETMPLKPTPIDMPGAGR